MDVFDVELGEINPVGVFPVEVRSSGGETVSQSRLKLSTLLPALPGLQNAVLASSTRTRRAGSRHSSPLRDIGSVLFDSVFSGSVGELYRSSTQAAESRGERLRLVLRIRSARLAVLPWELLYDAAVGEYLAQRHPLVRRVEVVEPVAPLLVPPPLKILAMVAGPQGTPELDAATEWRVVEEAVAGPAAQGLLEVRQVPGSGWRDLQAALAAQPPHVFHFIGHGDFDEDSGEGVILLADERGGPHAVSATTLSRLLRAAVPPPRLVLLNACESAAGSGDDRFSGTAATLVRAGVPAVVAMQFAITDAAAITFARALYEALVAGEPVDEAVRLARIALAATTDGSMEWVTPVLYLRSTDTRLIGPSPPPPLSLPAPALSGRSARAAAPPESAGVDRTPGGRGRRRRVRLLVIAALVLLVAIAAIGAFAASRRGTPTPRTGFAVSIGDEIAPGRSGAASEVIESAGSRNRYLALGQVVSPADLRWTRPNPGAVPIAVDRA